LLLNIAAKGGSPMRTTAPDELKPFKNVRRERIIGSPNLAQYSSSRNEDVWKEVKEGGREVTPAALPRFGDGPLDQFTAGPETTGMQRFGFTSYYRNPETPGSRTVAQGAIYKFWVSVDDVTRVKDEDVAAYLNQ
jgi:hypothetical protein